MPLEPRFLTLEQVEAIHVRSLSEHGGRHGIKTTGIDPMELYQPMIDVSAGKLDHGGLAVRMRKLFA